MQVVQDAFGRGFNGLRVSVTQRCNLCCPHCHREGQPEATAEMSPAEIGRIVEVATSLGARKVKITGGEPLLRDDICDVISEIRPHVREISLTTNGILLDGLSADLKRAGLDRINVSMHSLSGECLIKIAGMDYLDEVMGGLRAASAVGLKPIKINMVVLKDINHYEIPRMTGFASEIGATLELIELATDRSGCNEEFFRKHHFSLREVESQLAARAMSVTHNELHRRAQYRVAEGSGSVVVEVVRSMHNTTFCSNCTRLRLTSDGKLKGCLYENGHSPDILSAMRSGAMEDQLKEMFVSCIAKRRPYWS